MEAINAKLAVFPVIIAQNHLISAHLVNQDTFFIIICAKILVQTNILDL